MRYYSVDRLKATGCDYNFVISGRGPGKSTAIVNMLIDEHADNGGEFVRIARYNWECSRSLMGMWFNDVNRAHMEDVIGTGVVDYKNGYWCYTDAFEKERKIGYLVTLNDQDTFKSASFDRVTNIVYEEFACISERDYIDKEVDLFLSALSTIVRRRQNVRVWFIGNTLSKHNPFFDFFGIDVDRIGLHPGDIKTFRVPGFNGHGATLALEFAEMAEADVLELSPLMRVGGNVTATTGLYEIPPTVTQYAERTAGMYPRSVPFFPDTIRGVFGGERLYDVRITKDEVSDGRKLVFLSETKAGLKEISRCRWLNLSGKPDPMYTLSGNRLLRCVDRALLYESDSFPFMQRADYRAVHAYEDDDICYKWRNFIDMWGYAEERGLR